MGKTPKEAFNQELHYHLAGWILFIICALFFLASSLKNHDVLTLIGSLIFLVACVVFMVPLVAAYKKAAENKNQHKDKANA